MRQDLSNWVIHFVHRRNEAIDPLLFNINPKTGYYDAYPDNFTYDGAPIFLTNDYEEEYYGLEPDADAFSVLRKILHNGYIRAGWSYRETRNGLAPTIYGPKAAVCFTEMPLYALIEYAEERDSDYNVGTYGVAFLRDELFLAGARPVLYGLSSPHREANRGDAYYGIGFRNLHSSSGIGLREQYRYVATSLGSGRRIDWTHEREWRWADVDGKHRDPGIHFLIQNSHHSFSKVVFIVQKADEAKRLLDDLRSIYDAGTDNFDRVYNKHTIENSYILSLDQLTSLTGDLSKVRLDELPLLSLPRMKKVAVSNEAIEKVKLAVAKAEKLADAAAQRCYDEHAHLNKGNGFGPCGFAYVVTYDGYSEITQALLKSGLFEAMEGRYQMWVSNHKAQEIMVHEAAARAAASYLTETLGQAFYMRSKLD